MRVTARLLPLCALAALLTSACQLPRAPQQKLINSYLAEPADLANVPYEAIASLHNDSPLEHARMPTPRKRTLGTAYMATSPGITRPSGDFHPGDYSNRNRRR